MTTTGQNMSKKTVKVPGKGPADAKIMIIGEAPGSNEAQLGEPFVGRAGKTLEEWLTYLGVKREETYLTNVVKEQIPGNKTPTSAQIELYTTELMIEVNKLKPKLIILLGKTPTSVFLPEAEKLADVFGNLILKRFQGMHIAFFPLYHPSYINRMGRDKKDEVYIALDNLKGLVKNLNHEE